MNVTKTIFSVGVSDHITDLFEGQFVIPNGITYNSYLILDEKVAVMDSVDVKFSKEWLNKIDIVLEGRDVDYLVIQHMEPDHSSSIMDFIFAHPTSKIVSSEKSFTMMKNYFDMDFKDRRMVVCDFDILDLGCHKLTFLTAPMVHWPEVIISYDHKDKVIFSADAFGKFGIDDGKWINEARRYYFGVVGKYGPQVQKLLGKLKQYQIDIIAPLHGPILNMNLDQYTKMYDIWSSYEYETDGILIAYTSVYGNTKKAVMELKDELIRLGNRVVVVDLARFDMSEAVSLAFKYSKLVCATTTYNGGIFPFMREFISDLAERNWRNRTMAIINNGSWMPNADKTIKDMLSRCKNIRFCENTVKILSSLNDKNKEEINKLAVELTAQNWQ